MKNRPCVLFLPAASASNPNPYVIKIARGSFRNFEVLWEACSQSLPEALHDPKGMGQVFIGRENDPVILKPTPNVTGAHEWRGVEKSGSFEDFLRQRTAQGFFPQVSEAATA